VLQADQFGGHVAGAEKWQSAMTYKFVGALRGITTAQPHVMKALQLGILIGLVTEIARKLIKRNRRYKKFAAGSRTGFATDFVLDSFLLPSPYASSFGGFVELLTTVWWAAGGALASLYDTVQAKLKTRANNGADSEIPADMSTMSLVGGGLIAGDSLSALSVGIYGLLKTVL
jgi:hypothetical protein